MRKMLLGCMLALGAVMLFSGTPSFAVVPVEMHVTVPFAFYVEGTMLPAGRYVITNPEKGNVNVVEIKSADGKHAALVLTESVSPEGNSPRRPDLVFKNIDGTEHLTQIWADPGTAGNAIPFLGSNATATQAAAHRHHARNPQAPSPSGE